MVANRKNRVSSISSLTLNKKFDKNEENRYNRILETKLLEVMKEGKSELRVLLRHLKGVTIHLIGIQKAIENLLSYLELFDG